MQKAREEADVETLLEEYAEGSCRRRGAVRARAHSHP